MRRLVVATIFLAAVAPAHAGFRGTPYTRHQLVTRCYADCATYRDICRTTFQKGHVYRQCVRRLIYSCLGNGGSCSVGACPVCAADQICVNGSCFSKPKPKPVRLAPGNYHVSVSASGAVTIPPQELGFFPVPAFPIFLQAIQGAIGQFLAANGAAGCALSAGQSLPSGGGVDVTFSATCTDPQGNTISETVTLDVRP